MSVWINHDCIVCGHRFMHDVNKACICEHCTEFSKSVESRISQLERQLAEARKGTRDDIAIEAVNTHPLRFKNPNVAAFDAYRLADSMMIARIDDAAMAKEDSQ